MQEGKLTPRLRARKPSVPENHPLRSLLLRLTEMSFDETGVRDRQLVIYVADLLIDFVHIDNLYALVDEHGCRVENLLDWIASPRERGEDRPRDVHKQVGDVCLFVVGVFPESLRRWARMRPSPEAYVEEGKASYWKVAEFDGDRPTAPLFRKLSDRFEECVVALGFEKELMTDPFYQYLLRQLMR